jgi:hypothetical protein
MKVQDKRASSGSQEAKSFDGALLINVSVEVERVETFDDGSVGTETVRYIDRRASAGGEERLTELPLTINGRADAERTVEICRSFARKINLEHYGGKSYESADFFSSRKTQTTADDHARVSLQLFSECVGEIHESMLWYVTEMRARRAAANAQRLQAPPAMAANAKNFEAWRQKQDNSDVLL